MNIHTNCHRCNLNDRHDMRCEIADVDGWVRLAAKEKAKDERAKPSMVGLV